jgi:hypothetical protein
VKGDDMKLDKANADKVEEHIRPPMALAITLPVEDRPDLAVYVALSPFQSIQKPRDVVEVLRWIAAHLDFDEAAIAKGRKLEKESLIKRLRERAQGYKDAAVNKIPAYISKELEEIADELEAGDEKTLDSDNPVHA